MSYFSCLKLWFILIIPVITIIVLYSVASFRKKIAIWEPLVLLGVTSLLIGMMVWISDISQTHDTERYLDYVVSVEHHDYWNQWISKTCESCTTDSKGNEHCHTYDCSYLEEHSPYTVVYTKGGYSFSFKEGHNPSGWTDDRSNASKFIQLCKKFGTPISIESPHRSVIDKDYGYDCLGDVHSISWNGELERVEYTT